MSDKRVLILIGNFREMDYGDQPDAPSLVEHQGKRRAEHKEDVVSYLRAAPCFSLSPGTVEDYFDPKRSIGTFSMRTDGIYIWPDFVAGYVERYDVTLPEEFERHMAERNWQLPARIKPEELTPPWARS